MNLEIFERIKLGGGGNFTKPVLTVGQRVVYFNVASKREFKLTSEHLVILSIDRGSGVWYLCFLPELSNRKGYKLCHADIKKNSGYIIFGAKRYIDEGLESGYYSFGKPEFDGELDWYELIKFEDYDI